MADWTELKYSTSSVAAGFAKIFASFLAVCAISYLLQGIGRDGWPRPEYSASFLMPLLAMPSLVWFAFVPRRLRFNTEYLEFTSRFFGVRLLPLSKLRHWGKGHGVLLLEFEKSVLHRRTLQVALQFYTAESRSEFLQFLSENISDRKTSIWLGIRGITTGSR
jgi:hypothetical protein